MRIIVRIWSIQFCISNGIIFQFWIINYGVICIHELLSPVESQHLQLYNWSRNYNLVPNLRFNAIFSPFYQLSNLDKSYSIFLSELQLYETMYAYIKLKMHDLHMKTVELSARPHQLGFTIETIFDSFKRFTWNLIPIE